MDYTVYGILQEKMLERVAFPYIQGIPTQGLNPGLLHCRQILYQLSHKGSPVVKNLHPNAEDIRNVGLILGWEGPLEEGMTTHSSILAWRIPRTEEPGRLWSKAWHRVRHN